MESTSRRCNAATLGRAAAGTSDNLRAATVAMAALARRTIVLVATGPANGLDEIAVWFLGHHQPHARPPAASRRPRVLSAYSDLNTPALRAEKLCCTRPEQLEQLAALRHETCDGVELRLTDALEALRDTRVVFLGDSLMQNVFEALTTALHREGHAFRARRWNPGASSAASTTTSPAACARCATRAARRWAARSSTSNSRGRRAPRRAAGCSASTRRRARSAIRTRATTRRRARSTCR